MTKSLGSVVGPLSTTTNRRQLCVVTGGAGFIGCAISHELVKRFVRVVAIDNMHPQVHKTSTRPLALAPEAEFIVDDIRNSEMWDNLLSEERPDCVIHLAAETGTGQSLKESTRHVSVNLLGTSVMLDAFTRYKFCPKQFILTSSRAVYGEGAWRDAKGVSVYPGQRTKNRLEAGKWDFDDLTFQNFVFGITNPNPTNIYAATKLAQEHIVASWVEAHGGSVDIARLQNVYGPGQALHNSYTGIISLFANLSITKQQIELYEDGAMLRDFVFIEDVASALIAAVDGVHEGMRGFDVGLGQQTTIAEVAEFLAQRYHAPPPIVTGKFRFGDVRHAACDVSPTLSKINWKPQIPLTFGLTKLCEWMNNNEL